MKRKSILIVLVSIIMLVPLIAVHSQAKRPVSKSELKKYEFTTVSTNNEGTIVTQHKDLATYYEEPLGTGANLEMVAIPSGGFMMGSKQEDTATLIQEIRQHCKNGEAEKQVSAEQPQHQVNIKSFYMGKYEVTQAQWQAIMGTNPSYYKGDKLPVDSVSWNDAVEFCQKLSAKTGREYRLPNEAEWEYACRAGTTTLFSYGDNITPELVNYDGIVPYGSAPRGVYRGSPTEVGSFAPNGFGLYDMEGNIWEWCADIYHDNYNGAPTDGSAWLDSYKPSVNVSLGPNQSFRVLRGGSYGLQSNYCRAASRHKDISDNPSYYIFGLRVVSQ